MVRDRPSPDEIRDDLARVCAEPELARSQQLVDFLTYIVDKTLAEEGASLKAYTIATDVFGRDTSFDPQTDSIVRVQAGRLRKALETIYRRGVPGVKVRIDLPVGRYVPSFDWAEDTPEVSPQSKRFENESPPPQEKSRVRARLRRSRTALTWVASLVVVALAAFTFSWWMLSNTPTAEVSFKRPVIVVSRFEARDAAAGATVRGFTTLLVERLSAFDTFDTRLVSQEAKPDAPGAMIYRLGGEIELTDKSVTVRTIVTREDSADVVWAHAFLRPMTGETQAQTLQQLADRIAANVGAAHGAVQSDARARLPEARFSGSNASDYACGFLFRDALGATRAEETEAARQCYLGLVSANDGDVLAHAALAALDGFDVLRKATPDEDRAALLKKQIAAGAKAVQVYPASSFAHELYGRILLAAGNTNAAVGELSSALARNPGNNDAAATLGILEDLRGDRLGQGPVERAISSSLWPAGWYFTARAVDGLRRGDYESAVRHALTILPDDAELGLAILVAAAPGAGRADLLNAKLPSLLALPQFKAQGIMPRLSVRIADKTLLEVLRIGFIGFGLTREQLYGPDAQ